MKYLVSILFTFFLTTLVVAQNYCSLKGRVTDSEGNAIPYSSIYVPSISNGSMANIDGEFSLNLPCGEYEIIIQSLGFESKKFIKSVGRENDQLHVILQSVSYALKEIVVDPNSEDIAYNIIRKATVMAEYYKNQIQEYECKLYIRSFYNLDEIPWVLEKLADKDEINRMKAGEVEETILEYKFKRPNKVYEKIIARRTASNDTSKSSSSYVNLNFYNLGGESIINPLSHNAFQLYNFEHQHTEYQGNQQVHKIKVIPKRKGNDLMKGYLYINEGLWNLNRVDVEFNQSLVAIQYKQTYQQITKEAWMPIHHQIKVVAKAAGASMSIQYLATLSELEIKTDSVIDQKIRENMSRHESSTSKISESKLPSEKIVSTKIEQKIESIIQKEKLTNKEAIKLVRLIKKQENKTQKEQLKDSSITLNIGLDRHVKYEENALKRNDSLWNNGREIPLSAKEEKIYHQRDSLNKIENGDTTINKKRGLIGNLLKFEGTIKSKNKNFNFQPKGLIKGLNANFNTVDGIIVSKKLLTYEWNNKNGKFARIAPSVSYAFSRKTFLGDIFFTSQYNMLKRAGFNISAGRSSSDFNKESPLEPLINSISSLLFTENYVKLFQEDHIEIEHHFDIYNGLSLSTSLRLSNRTPLQNNSDLALLEIGGNNYTSNIPLNKEFLNRPLLLEANKASIFSATLSYTPKYFYTIRKGKKEMIRSKYPTFDLNYRQGISDFISGDINYQFLALSIRQSMSIGLIEKISYHVETGSFLENKKMHFSDYQNFNVQPFYVLGNDKINSFKLLDSYSFGTNNYYLEGHFTLEDNFILLKYLPLLNNTNITEELELNYLINEQKRHYTELGYSLNQLFVLFNVGTYVSFIDKDYQSFGFKIGLNIQ